MSTCYDCYFSDDEDEFLSTREKMKKIKENTIALSFHFDALDIEDRFTDSYEKREGKKTSEFSNKQCRIKKTNINNVTFKKNSKTKIKNRA